VYGAAVQPPEGAWFEYAASRHVGEGTGPYAGYSDDTTSTGRYEVSEVGGDLAKVRATYRWKFASNTGETDGGSEDRNASFATNDRHYLVQLDLDDDEYAGVDPTELEVWFWIPPDSPNGASLGILGQPCIVDGPVTEAGIPAGAIGVTCTTTGHRSDSYGEFATNGVDRFFFDAVSGLVVAERYEEHDVGSFRGEPATFTRTDRLDLTSASYAAGAPVAAPSGQDGPSEGEVQAIAGLVVAAFGLVFSAIGTLASMFAAFVTSACGFVATMVAVAGMVWLTIRLFQPPSKVRSARHGGDVLLHPVASATDVARAGEAAEASPRFGPFLEDFANKAVLAGGKAFVATRNGALVGFACTDPETGLATVLAPCPDVASGLVRWTGASEWFSDVRHTRGEKPIHNVLATYRVLELPVIPDLPYDRALVTRATDADRADVAALATAVYGTPAARWVESTFASGDLVYVARVDGELAGFAFATQAGDHGRLHGLSVASKHRDRGIGGELVRARLSALATLGVTDVISEIAETNLASLHVAKGLGFEDRGPMWVETSRSERVSRQVVRR
jgi:L-amino acid N-acyltransferase YncA